MVTLLTLPLEIRLQIYDSVLTTHSTLRLKSQLALALRFFYKRHVDHPQELLNLPDFQQTALLQTCRQVHDEASPIFYQSNTFNFELSGQGAVPDDDLEGVAGLDVMRNISVRIVWGPCSEIDRVLEKYPSARALTVHYTHPYKLGNLRKLLKNSLPTIQERLDQFTVVALDSIREFAELGKRFAIGYEGHIQLLSEWPHISLGSDLRSFHSDLMKQANSKVVPHYGPVGFCMGTWRRKRER